MRGLAAGARGRGGRGRARPQGQVAEGAAYEQETRKTIVGFQRVSKTASDGTPIIKDISLSMYLGAKIGVLGANGAGKSTLLKIMAGGDDAFDGAFEIVPGVRVGFLPQEPPLDDGATVRENIEPALAPVRALVEEFEQVGVQMGEPDADMDALLKRMDSLQTRIDACNGFEVERQLERAMEALRCPPGDAAVETLSGGERRRVPLTRLLLSAPDVLLLDEPTNHLDAGSVAWLERFLAEFRGTVVAVTHDRYFLDNVAGWILELDQGQGIPFEGNYSSWLSAKGRRLEGASQKRQTLLKAIEEEEAWIARAAKGQQKKGKARVGRIDELRDEARALARDAPMDSITIPLGPRLGDVVVEAEGLVKGFGDRCLLDGCSFQVPPGAIVGIVGGNGAGKSTLFRMIVGEETPDAGALSLGDTVIPMYVDQSRAALDADATVFETLSGGSAGNPGPENIDLGGREISARAYCSWFNFKGNNQSKKVGNLSGGERNRLQLAQTVRQAGNLLLLDEPTNDLDVDTLRALEGALLAFSGAAMVISHDRWFLDRVCTHILAFEGDSQTVWFDGSYSEYERDLRERTGGRDPAAVKYRPMPALS